MPLPKRLLILAAVAALAVMAVPTVVSAAGGAFIDDDTSQFEADIEWLATANVTKGCNPPTNDQFCPNSNVTRGQMAAFMKRFASYLGAEDGVVTNADNAQNSTNALNATNAQDASTLGGHDPSYFTKNSGYSVHHDAVIDVPAVSASLLELQNLPPGSYLFIAKTWFHHGGVSGDNPVVCDLNAGLDRDEIWATLGTPNDGLPATLTVVHTFTAATNSVTLSCQDWTGDVSLNDTKITGIRLDSELNQPG